MFVLLPPKDPPTMAFIEEAVEPIRESFEGYENVLLMILQVEGRPELCVYYSEDRVLEKIQGVEAEAEMFAAEIAFEDRQIRETKGQYFCTVVEYLPRTKKYARAVTGLLFPNPQKSC